MPLTHKGADLAQWVERCLDQWS